MICERYAKRYCKDFTKIENYEKAMADTKTWHCHHRAELVYTAKELKEKGMYYNVLPCDLIFLTHSEHCSLHRKWEKPWNKGKKSDPLSIQKYIATRRKNKKPAWNRKKVRCIETNELFDSVEEAAKAKGLKSHAGIVSVANGKAMTAGNLHWEYVQ